MLQTSILNRVAALSTELLAVPVLLVCALAVVAQQTPSDRKSMALGASSAAENGTRARRIHEPGKEGPAESKETDSRPSGAQDEASTSALRDQIAAAKTPAEQTRLRFVLVDQLVDAGMKSEANAELRAMVAEDRFDPPTFYNLGNRLVRLGNLEAAVGAYRKAIDQRNGNYSRALNNLGAALLRLGRWDEAHEALSSALRLEKFHYAEASFNLGRLYAVRGETDLAIREWQRALAADSQHSGAARALANVKNEGRIRVSDDAKDQAKIAATPRPGVYTKARNAMKSETTTNPKTDVMARPLTVDQATFMLLQQARSARERGRHEEAVLYYRNVLAHTGGYFAPANLELTYSLIYLKRTDEAIAALIPVSTIDGARYPICYYHLARLYEAQGRLKLAEENYSLAASAYSGRNAQFLLDLSRVREKLGDLVGALAALEQYVQAAERVGPKLDWSDARLNELRTKISAASTVPTKP